jgi:hypothetical protein
MPQEKLRLKESMQHLSGGVGGGAVGCSEGLLLHNIARHDDADPRPTFDLVIGAALA